MLEVMWFACLVRAISCALLIKNNMLFVCQHSFSSPAVFHFDKLKWPMCQDLRKNRNHFIVLGTIWRSAFDLIFQYGLCNR